jgi:hypothetical protein
MQAADDEIVFPLLGPGEQVTVTYLYFPPRTYHDINNGIRSDEGPARAVPMQLQQQFPKWGQALIGALMATGFVVWLALVIWLVRALFRYFVGTA